MELEPTFYSSLESCDVGNLFDSNLPANCYNAAVPEMDKEYDLTEAVKQAVESGSMTPLIKQELKLRIQSRRLSQGKPELKVGFTEPSSHQLTPAEVERRLRRKDQNKQAARRFRQNKKLRQASLIEEINMLEAKNDALRDTISELQRLKEDLLQRLNQHMLRCLNPSCDNSTTSTITTTTTTTTTNITIPPLLPPPSFAACSPSSPEPYPQASSLSPPSSVNTLPGTDSNTISEPGSSWPLGTYSSSATTIIDNTLDSDCSNNNNYIIISASSTTTDSSSSNVPSCDTASSLPLPVFTELLQQPFIP